MQFDLLRAFPYPVLRPKVDDYVDGDIQATVTFEHRTTASTWYASGEHRGGIGGRFRGGMIAPAGVTRPAA
jgi:hypothetical protein